MQGEPEWIQVNTVNQSRILIVEDEQSILEAVSYALQSEGYCAVAVQTGTEALQWLSDNRPDLVILDVGLPDISGFDLFNRIRTGDTPPVIFLTARDGEVDRVAGLEMGADDYVTKPFSPRELTARVRAVLRRTALGRETERVERESGFPFRVDTERRIIAYHGEPVSLSRCAYGILEMMIRRPGRVFSRRQLMEAVWDVPDVSDERTVDTHVRMIRSALREIREEPDPIVTHRGVGYALREDW